MSLREVKDERDFVDVITNGTDIPPGDPDVDDIADAVFSLADDYPGVTVYADESNSDFVEVRVRFPR